jgi:hypothetical protein
MIEYLSLYVPVNAPARSRLRALRARSAHRDGGQEAVSSGLVIPATLRNTPTSGTHTRAAQLAASACFRWLSGAGLGHRMREEMEITA